MTKARRILKKYVLKTLKILGWIVMSLVILFITLVLVIRSSWGQDFIVSKAADFVSNKIDTEFSIDRLFLTFTGNAYLEGLYLEDQQGDTLIYSRSLEVSLALLPLIKGETIDVKLVDWSGLTANVSRPEAGEYNFNFIIEAFASSDTTSTQASESSSNPEIKIGEISISDFDLSFIDKEMGIETSLMVGNLLLEMNEFDLEGMRFDVEELTLENSRISYEQQKSLLSSTDTSSSESSTLPVLIVEEININNVEVVYNAIPDKIYVDTHIGELEMELPLADIASQKIDLKRLFLANTEFNLSTSAMSGSADTAKVTTSSSFEWPDWMVTGEEITFSDNNFHIQTDSIHPTSGVFEPSVLAVTGFGFEITDLSLQDQQASVNISSLNFQERSGFTLKDLDLQLDVNDQKLALSDIRLVTEKNKVTGTATFSYPSIASVIEKPEEASFDLNLDLTDINISEAYYFVPSLSKNTYFRSLAAKTLNGTLQVSGDHNRIKAQNTHITWGDSTEIYLDGTIANITSPDTIMLDKLQYSITSSKKDLMTFMPDSIGISLPSKVQLTGSATGALNGIHTENTLNTSEGTVLLSGDYTNKDNNTLFDLRLETDSLRLDKILHVDQLGAVSAVLSLTGSGTELATLDARLTADFQQLEYNEYDFSAISLQGQMDQGDGNVTLDYKDENLDMNLDSRFTLDTAKSKINLVLNLKGADLKRLGITQKDIRTRLKFTADFVGSPESFDATITLEDALAVYARDSYPFDKLIADLHIREDTTGIKVTSSLIDIDLFSNAGPSEIIRAVQSQVAEYMDPDAKPDSVRNPVEMQASIVLKQDPLIDDIFLTQLNRYEPIVMSMEFREAENNLTAYFSAPYIDYGGNVIDSLSFEVQGDSGQLEFKAGWEAISAEPLMIEKTLLSGELDQGKLLVAMNVQGDGEPFSYIQSEFEQSGDTTYFHINPEGLLHGKKEWSISPDNQIIMAKNHIDFQNFRLHSNEQELTVKRSLNNGLEDINLALQGFRLSTLTAYLNQKEPLANGMINGEITLEDVFGKSALLADLQIDSFKIRQADMGSLSLKGSSAGGNNYDFNMALTGGNADLELEGSYVVNDQNTTLDIDLALNEVQMKILEKFAPESFSEASGIITGNMNITGSPGSPEYSGEINFDQAAFVATAVSTRFTFPDEQLNIENESITLNNFTILDADKNRFTLDGQISTESFINPGFDLVLKATNFQALNSKGEDIELFYGKVIMDADLTIRGDLNVPIVRGNATVKEGSAFTYVVPETQLQVIEREGVVLFVNKEDPDAILTRIKGEQTTSAAMEEMDVDIELKVEQNSILNIVINERTGDNFQVSGTGDFALNIDPNGRTSLYGRYDINDGHYEASLYNLVKRRFEIGPGSSISWSGDPMEAQLDITAIYKVSTSTDALMAAQTSSADETEASRYQERLPFLVYLNVEGSLLQPSLNFRLDMPEEEQGELGGNVYSRIQQLNSQEEQLNKQVFSLLVLNRFFPASGSDGSSGGAESIARNNVSRILSGQLNTLSDKLVGGSGFDLDFGLSSYTQGDGQSRTELDVSAQQSLFDERLIVKVGSEVNIEGSGQETSQGVPMLGNVSLEYLLTENGRYRLKGFRKNEFENVIDGQLIITGLAFIFNREFNKFSNLWGSDEKNKEEAANDSEK